MTRLATFILLALPLLAGATRVQADSAPDLAAYRAAVHGVRLQLDALAESPSPPETDWRAIATRLRSLDRVRLPDGRAISTDLPALANDVGPGSSVSLRQAAQTLDALDMELGGTRVQPAAPADLGALDAVLRDGRFHPSENVLQRFFDWVGAQVDRLLSAISTFLQNLVSGGPSASLPTFVFAAIFLAIVVGAALLVARAALNRALVSPREVDERDEPRTSVSARERLDRSVAAGDYRLALRYLLLATLLQLQELGALRLRPGLTNREYLRDLEHDLKGNVEVAEPMGALIDAFDRTWYGHLTIDRAQFERCRELAEAALRAAERVSAA